MQLVTRKTNTGIFVTIMNNQTLEEILQDQELLPQITSINVYILKVA